ncbi:MAG: 4-hydroxy-tetrahydrodipicolinate reductase [Caulobacteraceae bacterium]|nr:4-hydroxy-tetrahydrodipicolinate reductase [Caulobacteraceae bacterium]
MSADGGIRIGVAGARGRMGRVLAAAVEARAGLSLTALFGQPGSAGSVVDGRGLVARDVALAACDVIIDFTSGAASADLARACALQGGPALVIGSTGLGDADEAAVAAAAQAIPIVKSGNFSLGVNLLLGLVAQAARVLPASAYDIEVFEAHHRRKVDAPSGTALMLGQAAAGGRGVALTDVEARTRDGLTGPRPEGQIGFSVMRAGGIVGEHSVLFAAEDEILTLSHSARDRSLFARGAVEAAAWLAGKPAGLYDMQDVLGLAGP